MWVIINVCQQLFLHVILIYTFYTTLITGQLLTIKEHRTPGATQRVNDLSCYQCDSMDDGERCIDLAGNRSIFERKCDNEKRICMVKHVSLTMSSENSTTQRRMWSLERRCTKNCEPGCIVIGERTKIFACTSCCETSNCNIGNSAATSPVLPSLISFSLLLVIITLLMPNIFYNGPILQFIL